ncbi:MAG: glucose-6-phosphate dehydrogenase [Patescibacteria group bacterium]|nr:glucose-6-phosphate dehydrogenase [Patescibacteria group bacterium]
MPSLDKSVVKPAVLTIFGATGHLSRNYLLPALYRMDVEGLLPPGVRVVCVGRRDFDARQYLDFVLDKSKNFSGIFSEARKGRFLKHLDYYRGDFENERSFAGLARLLDAKEGSGHHCFDRLYYFATSPEYFSPIADILKKHGLLKSCKKHERQIRLLVEKPFGFDLNSARKLNRQLAQYFTEAEIYRIDHYLGKETVQNLMVARFANSLFEPLWNRDHIDHIELSVLYSDRVGGREYFDAAGALRDVVQNHTLQMLALILMNEPKELLTGHIQDEKVKVLAALRPFSAATAAGAIVRGQYQGYAKELGRSSPAETFVALKTFVESPRWDGVPIYIRSGMAMAKKVTEISVHFKEPLRCLFRNCSSNILTFRIQPDESVYLRINNKIPGFGIELRQADLNFSYASSFRGTIPAAYERLLLDFIQGDQRLFIRADEIEAAWRFVDSIRKHWGKLPLLKYQPGTFGPKAAEDLIKRDFREWFTR